MTDSTQARGEGQRRSEGRAGRYRGASLPILTLSALAAWHAVACSSAPHPAPAPAPAARGAAADQVVGVEPQREWRDAVLYFVIVDRFADGDPTNNLRADPSSPGTFHGGDLAGLRGRLDDLAELGVTALWITPVVKNIPGFVTGAGFPDWGYHGYWADDFESIDPRFGTETELAALVSAAHARGMKVLLDVVYNHAGYESRYTTSARTRGWLRSEALGSCGADDLTSCLAGLPDFRTELPEVADYLMRAHLGLAKRVGLDGFRLDTVKHVDHPFWQEHRRRSRQELGNRFFLVGEVWGGDAQSLDPWFAGDELDAGFDFGFQGSVLGWLQGRGRTVAFERYLRSREAVRDGHLLAHFLSSHDVPGALHQLDGDRALFRLAAILQMTVAGLPTIYYGEEVGRRGGEWPANRSDMPWADLGPGPGRGLPRDEALRDEYRRWIGIRRRHPALWRGRHESMAAPGDPLVFGRRDGDTGELVLVAVNRGADAARVDMALPAGWEGRRLRDELAGSAIEPAGGRLALELPGRGAMIVVAADGPG